MVLVHHCGKSGEQRGTGAREDHLDTSIKLSRVQNENNRHQGCRFQVNFTKARGCYGDSISPFIATLTISNEKATWEISTIEESTKEKLINIVTASGEDGITVTDAAIELSISKGMVSRLKKQCDEEGILQYSSGKSPMRIKVEHQK